MGLDISIFCQIRPCFLCFGYGFGKIPVFFCILSLFCEKIAKTFCGFGKMPYFCTRKQANSLPLANALLAQLVEQLTLNQWVQGSNP